MFYRSIFPSFLHKPLKNVQKMRLFCIFLCQLKEYVFLCIQNLNNQIY